ncbi:hypothetical protein JNW98_01360, partial [Streptomyces sp. SCA2-4]|nr:hypothetical protein [Streptomyces huiliensis]
MRAIPVHPAPPAGRVHPASTRLHSAVTRLAAVAVATLALGGCMSVSEPGRPAPSASGRQRESGARPDGGKTARDGRPEPADAKGVRGAGGS